MSIVYHRQSYGGRQSGVFVLYNAFEADDYSADTEYKQSPLHILFDVKNQTLKGTYPINQSTVSRRYSGNLSSLANCRPNVQKKHKNSSNITEFHFWNSNRTSTLMHQNGCQPCATQNGCFTSD